MCPPPRVRSAALVTSRDGVSLVRDLPGTVPSVPGVLLLGIVMTLTRTR
jgi:hypothetical protein